MPNNDDLEIYGYRDGQPLRRAKGQPAEPLRVGDVLPLAPKPKLRILPNHHHKDVSGPRGVFKNSK